MIVYDLPLERPLYRFRTDDLTTNNLVKEKLEGITDFKEKLKYFNENVQSLSTYPMAGQIYFEYGKPSETIKIYCACPDCRQRDNFNPEHEKIFFELRAKEVERIVNEIGQSDTYKGKLAVLFNTKGYYSTGYYTVTSNREYNGTIVNDADSSLIKPIIDLTPRTEDQLLDYNELAKLDFNRKYRIEDGFSEAYKYFEFEKEKQRFLEVLRNSGDRDKLIDYVIKKIEKSFNYSQSINIEHDNNQALNHTKQQLEEFGIIDNLFTILILVGKVDLNKYRLIEYTLMDYTHVSEIVKFYKFLKELNWNEIPIANSGVTNLQNGNISVNEDTKAVRKRYQVVEKTFPEYLLHENKAQLAEMLKKEFNTEKGKRIRLMIEVLQDYKLLSIENRQKSNVFNALRVFFSRDIGTYNAAFTSYKFDKSIEKTDFDATKIKVDFILRSMNNYK